MELGESWIDRGRVTRSVRLTATTAKTSRKEIAELSLEHPSWGPKRIAAQLKQSRGYGGSPSTVHNILARVKLGTKTERAAELDRRQLAGAILSEEQQRSVQIFSPLAGWKWDVGTRLGEILTQDVHRFHHSSPFGTAPISVVADTFTGWAFVCFTDLTRVALTTDCARKAIEELKRTGNEVRAMYIDSDSDFGGGRALHPYTTLLREHKIARRVIEWPSNRPNPCVVDVLDHVRRFLCEGGVAKPEQYRESLWKLNPIIREFLDTTWNSPNPV